jgi:poly(hydroxyalkanoate) granule-associated protein
MTVEDKTVEQEPLERPPLAELIRKVMLAGIGAAALAQEEAEAFIHKLIEKGELAEKDGRDLMKDLREKRRKKAEEEIDKRITVLIERMNIPTKSDIETLSQKINDLSKKVDHLKD